MDINFNICIHDLFPHWDISFNLNPDYNQPEKAISLRTDHHIYCLVTNDRFILSIDNDTKLNETFHVHEIYLVIDTHFMRVMDALVH